MKHPMYSKELLRMFDEDQVEIRSREKVLAAMQTDAERERYRLQITENCHRRAARTLEILDAIGAPTIENIGPAAAEIVSVLVLHSYVDEMKRLLKIYEKQYIRDPDSIYRQAIPPLTDRIMIVEQRKQKFGTNWNVTDEGQWFLISVEDLRQRVRYGHDMVSGLSKSRGIYQ